jgi:hypothetical protein
MPIHTTHTMITPNNLHSCISDDSYELSMMLDIKYLMPIHTTHKMISPHNLLRSSINIGQN